jgi:hypothetical protein
MPRNRKQRKQPETCREVVELLSEYLSAELTDKDMVAIRRHFAGCPPCERFFGSLETTVAWTRKLRHQDIPSEVLERLKCFLKDRTSNSRQ